MDTPGDFEDIAEILGFINEVYISLDIWVETYLMLYNLHHFNAGFIVWRFLISNPLNDVNVKMIEFTS